MSELSPAMTDLSLAAQAVWGAHEQVLENECVLTKTDMKALAAALREVINQTQNGQGMISAAELYLIAARIEKL